MSRLLRKGKRFANRYKRKWPYPRAKAFRIWCSEGWRYPFTYGEQHAVLDAEQITKADRFTRDMVIAAEATTAPHYGGLVPPFCGHKKGAVIVERSFCIEVMQDYKS